MTRASYRYECDNDLIHDGDEDTEVVDLEPEQAQAAELLGWPVTATRNGPRARLSDRQQQTIAALVAWRHQPC